MSAFLRKYATATTINFPLIALGTVNFTSTATMTTADMKLSLNEGVFTTVGTAIVNEGSYGYSYTMTTADLTAARVAMVIISTAATKVCEDSMILIETYGHTNAQHTFDFSVANQTVIASAGTVTLTAGQVVTVGTNNDKTGYSLSQTFPTNFADLSISATTGAVKVASGTITAVTNSVNIIAGQVVTVGTNNDKTGYSLTQTFPTNFADLSITVTTGLVSISTAASVNVGTNNDKTGYSLTQTFPSNFADLTITATTGLVSISTAALVNVGTIANGAITAAAIAAGAISAGGIATGAIDADALATDAVAEIWGIAGVPSTAVPAWTASMLSQMSWMFALSKNTITQTSVLQVVMQSDGITSLAASTLSDDLTTFQRTSFN